MGFFLDSRLSSGTKLVDMCVVVCARGKQKGVVGGLHSLLVLLLPHLTTVKSPVGRM